MKKFNKLQDKLERQCGDFRNKINEWKEYFTEKNEILKKNQTNSGAEELKKLPEDCISMRWK